MELDGKVSFDLLHTMLTSVKLCHVCQWLKKMVLPEAFWGTGNFEGYFLLINTSI